LATIIPRPNHNFYTLTEYHHATAAVQTAALHSALLIRVATSAPTINNDFCGFYSESRCENQEGSTTYKDMNDGIFQNGGPCFTCANTIEFTLIQYGNDDPDGDNPEHCEVFTEESGQPCNHLDDLGFQSGSGYWRISTDKTCPSVSRRNQTSSDDTMLSKRDPSYFTFCADPACEQLSGGTDYYVKNDGCLENGGAYGIFGSGDDFDWSLFQYSGIDDEKCSMTWCTVRCWMLSSKVAAGAHLAQNVCIWTILDSNRDLVRTFSSRVVVCKGGSCFRFG
jgi:hypothetical protein